MQFLQPDPLIILEKFADLTNIVVIKYELGKTLPCQLWLVLSLIVFCDPDDEAETRRRLCVVGGGSEGPPPYTLTLSIARCHDAITPDPHDASRALNV